MNATETAKLCAAIAQSAPAQKFDDDTPAFWAVLLADVRYEDARTAIIRLLQAQPFIAPADIVTQVRKMRDGRIDNTEAPVPNVHPDDLPAYLEETAAIREAIADGTFDATAYTDAGVPLTGHRPRYELPGTIVSRGRALERFSAGLFPRPERPLAVHYSDATMEALSAPRTVSKDEAVRMETERRRQLAALEHLDPS